jgi:hypothetical protein
MKRSIVAVLTVMILVLGLTNTAMAILKQYHWGDDTCYLNFVTDDSMLAGGTLNTQDFVAFDARFETYLITQDEANDPIPVGGREPKSISFDMHELQNDIFDINFDADKNFQGFFIGPNTQSYFFAVDDETTFALAAHSGFGCNALFLLYEVEGLYYDVHEADKGWSVTPYQAPVPEPATLLLFGLGFGFLGSRIKRTKPNLTL